MSAMRCKWQKKVDEGNGVLLILDKNSLNDPEVRMQVAYARSVKKPIVALIELGAPLPKVLVESPDLIFEYFDSSSEKSLQIATEKLFRRHYERSLNSTSINEIAVEFII